MREILSYTGRQGSSDQKLILGDAMIGKRIDDVISKSEGEIFEVWLLTNHISQHIPFPIKEEK